LELPYLFKTPLGIRGNFNLFRQDSSWSNRNFGLELGYQIASGTFLNLGWDNSQSAVLQSAASASQGNVRASVVQTGITVRRFNDPLLPTKGLFLSMRIGQGTRQLETENFQLRQGHIEGQFYHTFNKKHGLFARVMAAGIFSDNLVENELHRLGGFKTLRGFNELTLFAANYGLANLEYRFFLERYSYLVAFFDAGILYNPVAIAPNLNLMGTGVGLNFRTGGGIFSLAVAVGRAPNQNFDLRLSKVHVGFVNQF
jgi:outer membrane protein assembly factor BamA